MNTTKDIPDFEIPSDGKDLLVIGDFEFDLVENNCNWGTGGIVQIFAITTDTERAIKENFLSKSEYHGKGVLKIIFHCDYSYPEGVANKELNFVEGRTSAPDYIRIESMGAANGIKFYGKATLLDGWLGLNGFLKDSFNEDRCWPISLVRKRTPDTFDWKDYEFSLEEAMQIHPELVSRIRIVEYKGLSLPVKFSKFKKLTHLSIYEKIIDEQNSVTLQQLPDAIGDFKQLVYLSVKGTLLEDSNRFRTTLTCQN